MDFRLVRDSPHFLHKAIRSDVASLSKTLSSNRTEESKVRSPNSSDPVAECRCTRPSAHAARCPCQPAACHPRCSCRSWTPTAGASPAVTVPSQQRPLPTVFARSLAALAYVERARHGCSAHVSGARRMARVHRCAEPQAVRHELCDWRPRHAER